MFTAPPEIVDKVDLLLEVDNTGSMKDNQAALMAQLEPLVQALVAPPCTSRANPTPHVCDPSNDDDQPQAIAVRSLHVGVVSTDLGTQGVSVPGCVAGASGDDGLLNPIHFGPGLRMHEPTPGSVTAAPDGFRPESCTDPNQYPSFIAFDSSMAAGDPSATTNFATDFRCNAGLYLNGCGLEQQLESINRAINPSAGGHDASDHAGNTDPNAGFLRDDAILAIVLLSDEEDGSTRPDAFDVYSMTSTNWSSADLNLRMYMYQPCGPQDPTYPLDRYINPRDPTAGWPALKPGHPERVVFAAITGVPLDVDANGFVDWSRVLGTPGPNGPDDFCGRDSSALGNLTSAEGRVSMQQANPDPNCGMLRTVPACRREGTTDDPSHSLCQMAEQYFAWPARRIAEVARRFEQAPLCRGAPCSRGLLASICSSSYEQTVAQIAAKIRVPVQGGCLFLIDEVPAADGTFTTDCVLHELVPATQESRCDAAQGRVTATGLPDELTHDGVTYHVCDIAQLAATHQGPADPNAVGWYLAENPAGVACGEAIGYQGTRPRPGAITKIQCAPRDGG